MPHFDDPGDLTRSRTWLTGHPEAALVFVHGFGEHAGLSERLARPLNAGAIDLWSLDRAGNGPDDGEAAVVGSIDGLAADARRLTAIVQAHHPALPIFIAGHSLGGVAAALAVTRDPSAWAGAVLAGTPIDPPDWVDRALALGDSGLQRVVGGLASDPWSPSAPAIDLLAFVERSRRPLQCLAAAWFELAERFSSVPLPMLLVHGQDDPVAPVAGSRWWAERFQHARLIEFTDARRDVLNERMHGEIAAWVLEHVPAAADAESGA